MRGTVLFTKKRPKGFFGFIEGEDGQHYYFDNSLVLRGDDFGKGTSVRFDPKPAAKGQPHAVNVEANKGSGPDKAVLEKVRGLLLAALEEKQVLNLADIPALLNSKDIDYKKYSSDLSAFLRDWFPGEFLILRNVRHGRKTYLAALVKCEALADAADSAKDTEAAAVPGSEKEAGKTTASPTAKEGVRTSALPDQRDTSSVFSDQKLGEINRRLLEMAHEKGYVQCAILPAVLSELGVSYKDYAPSITAFIQKYLTGVFRIRTRVPVNGKIIPAMIVPLESVQDTAAVNGGAPKEQPALLSSAASVLPEKAAVDLAPLAAYLGEGKYAEFLRSDVFRNTAPDKLGTEGVQLAIRAAAGLLGDSTEIVLNDFQKALIRTVHAADLAALKNDEEILRQGAESASVPMTQTAFRAALLDVCFGKNNLNNNWNALAERFYGTKNELAIYINVLWLAAAQNEKCLGFYIHQCTSAGQLKRLPDMIRVFQMFPGEGHSGAISLPMKKIILGACLDYGAIDLFCSATDLFDTDTMPEAKELGASLRSGTLPAVDTLMGYFYADTGAVLMEKLVNYWWYQNKDAEHIPETIIQLLSSICFEYDRPYIESVLFNSVYDDFREKQKARLLAADFPDLCAFTKVYPKTFLLVSYIHDSLSAELGKKPDADRETDASAWTGTLDWMVSQVKSRFTNDPETAASLTVFRYVPETMHQLEQVYCETCIRPEFDRCVDETALKDLIDRYRKADVPFITQWINTVYDASPATELETLIRQQRFPEAVQWTRKQAALPVSEKMTALRKILCENSRVNGFSEKTWDILEQGIPETYAENILLDGLSANQSETTGTLLSLYIHEKNWLKATYMYIPFRKIKGYYNPALLSQSRRILLENGIDPEKRTSHFEVIKVAVRVLNDAEFDAFIDWAKKIPIPYASKAYVLKPRPFDANLKEMLQGDSYPGAWDYLLKAALMTDKQEQQDMLRYSIIASYLGRYGADRFDSIISQVFTKAPEGRDYYSYYGSIWRGLVAGKYGANFFALNLPLVETAPLTYWNLFYEVAVCRNRVFTRENLWGTQWTSRNYDREEQDLYAALVRQYSDTRETVFLQIAVAFLLQYSGTVDPAFDLYLSYCNSSKNKDFLLRAMIHLAAEKKYLREMEAFLNSGSWYLTETERRLCTVLSLLCGQDSSLFSEQPDLHLDAYEADLFRADFLEALWEYPRADVVKVIHKRTDTSADYRYQLIRTVFQIVFVERHFASLQNEGLLDPPVLSGEDHQKDALLVHDYALMMDVCYKQQLRTDSRPNLIWVQNRYHRILALRILLSGDASALDDEYVVSLMQANRHYSDVIQSCRNFRDALKEVVSSPSLTDEDRQDLLLSIVSNNWKKFLGHIGEYEDNALTLIGRMMELTNFRELNMQILEQYLLVRQEEYDAEDIRKVAAYSGKLGYVLKELLRMKREDPDQHSQIFGLVVGICRLKQQNSPGASYDRLDYTLKMSPDVLAAHEDLFSAALWSTSYRTTILFRFGHDVRSPRTRCTLQKLKSWEPVFRSGSMLSVYWYLAAVWYAADRNREEAKEAYGRIAAKGEIPLQWNQERLDLEAFISGASNRFTPNENAHFSMLTAETETRKTWFVDRAAAKGTPADKAAEAYRNLEESAGREEKLSACRRLFGFVHNTDDLYELYRKIDFRREKGSKKTFNELVILFGALLITADEEIFTRDEKFDILSDMVDIWESLSDVNREKESVKKELRACVQKVLGTPGLGFDTWIKHHDRILEILCHPAAGSPGSTADELRVPLEACAQGVAACASRMEVLDWLSDWRSRWNISANSSDYERAFVMSADQKLQELRQGANLRLTVINDRDLIEDDCVFYQVENTGNRGSSAVLLDNSRGAYSGGLGVSVSINGGTPEAYDNPEFSTDLELRPGDICGQVYRLHRNVLDRIHPGDTVEVVLTITVNGEIICCNGRSNRVLRYEKPEGILTPDCISSSEDYNTEVPAFSKMIRGFGREREKKQIRDCLDQNLAIIYGASRVGKSSLLNYISNDYVYTYQAQEGHQDLSIVTVSVAYDDPTDQNDYSVSMLDSLESVEGYDSGRMMDYLFLAPLRIAFDPAFFLKRSGRVKAVGGHLPADMQKTIVEILNHEGSVREKYAAIASVLEENRCEVWLLYDEFQEVVERWSAIAPELTKLCSEIKYRMSGIRLVLCGSDGLLSLFECEEDPTWNDFRIRTSRNSIPVGQLEYADFAGMIHDPKIWIREGNTDPFSESALQLLHRYTGGNAICGKIFGNEILRGVKEGKYADRRKIYPSDITEIAYSLLAIPGAVNPVRNLLIAHNNKNLENEKKYLLFIAHALTEDTSQVDVSYDRIRSFFASRSTAEIDLALKILTARGILEKDPRENSYGFTTMFYFDFFRSQVTESVMEELEAAEHTAGEAASEHETESVDEQLLSYFSAQTPNRQAQLIGGLLPVIHDEAKANVRKVVGDWFGGDKYHTEFHISAQSISVAFNTLLAGDTSSMSFKEALQSLPRMSAYLTDTQKAELHALSGELSECETEEDILETQNRIESLTGPARQQLLSDTVSAAVTADDFMELSDARWMELLGIVSMDELRKVRGLPAEILTPLGFAVMLQDMFSRIESRLQDDTSGHSAQELDYCPVSIMYCKVVEAMLKKYHTPVYIRRIGDATLRSGGRRFSDLLAPDGTTILPSKDLTIGSFAHSIVATGRNNDINRPQQFSAFPKKSMIRRITGITDYSAAVNMAWDSHARDLAVILAVRNKSAHEASPVSRANFEWLVHVLFGDGELVRIARLADGAPQ